MCARTLRVLIGSAFLWLLTMTVAVASLGLTPDTVPGGTSATAMLTLSAPAPAGGLAVALSSSSTAAQVPASVTVPAGQTTCTFTVTTGPVEAQVLATITAMVSGTAQTAALTINPISLAAFTLSQAGIVGGNPLTATVTLTGPAPAGGSKIALACSAHNVAVPATVSIPASQTTATVTIPTTRTSAKVDTIITATLGYVASSANLSVFPMGPLTVAFKTPTVAGGSKDDGTVTLTGPAPKGGMTVNLGASDRSLKLPASVKVPEGQTTATFQVLTVKAAAQLTASVTARYEGQAVTAPLVITPPTVSAIVFNPASAVGSSPVGTTLMLTDTAPPGGLPITLSADKPNDADVVFPTSVVVPAGKSTISFTLKTMAVAVQTVVNVKAAVGPNIKPAPLTLLPPTLISLTLENPTVDGGTTCDAIIRISSPSPDAGVVVTLTCDQKAAICPVKFTIGDGHTAARFHIKTIKVMQPVQAVITATFNGVTQKATLSIN